MALMTVPASALVVSGTASGTAANIDLSVLNLVGLSTGDIAGVSGTAPPILNAGQTAVPISASAGVTGVLSLASLTGTGTTTATSNVDGSAGSRTSAGSGIVVGVGLTVADLPLAPPLLEISADALGTTSTVSGDSGALTAGGTFTATNLVVKVSGAAVSLGLPPVIAPNTGVDLNALGLAGIILHLNEVTVTGNGLGTRSVTRTALRVEVNALSLGALGAVNGGVIIGKSSASLTSDADSDGVPDGVDADTDNDGIPDAAENAQALNGGDTDSDGVADYLDLDSDNDGIYDVFEAGHGAADTDHNGRIDGGPPAFGANGLANSLETAPESGLLNYSVADTDADGRKDYTDLDSDNDSISDLLESGDGSLTDDNHNGVADGVPDTSGVVAGAGTVSPVNSGGGAPADYRDPDSDGDGITDITDNGFSGLDINKNGAIDNITDADLDGIADNLDTEPGVFGGFPVTGCSQWAVLNPVDTDADVFPIDQEYAFGGSPLSGGHLVSGTAAAQGLVLYRTGSALAGTGKIHASVVRPQGRYDVTYTLLAGASLTGSWTPLTAQPVVTVNGDGTDTLTWTDLQSRSPLGADTGFVRLQVETPCHPLATVTLVQGWHQVTVAGTMQSYGVNFTSLPVLTGKVGSITGSALATPSGGGLDLSTLISGDIPSYVEFTDGTALGHRIDLSGGAPDSLTLNLASVNNTTSVLPSGMAGSHFVVRRHRTFGDILPNSEWASALSSGSADRIHMYNGSGYDIYFNYANPSGTPYWLSTATGNANARVLAPGHSVFLSHALSGSVTPVLQLGSVRYSSFLRPLTKGSTGLNPVTQGFPLDSSPASLGMTAANGFTAAFSAGSSSQIQIWKGDAAPNTTGFTPQFLISSFWLTSTQQNVTADPLFKTSRGAMVLVRADNPFWNQGLPWNPFPWEQP